MVEIKSDAAMDAMREAGRVVGRALAAVRKAALPGTRPVDLDEVARGVIAEAGARPAFLHYHPPFA
ncbi:type I methionyl aminopeptidase, partial [Streptomyces calidiresistens]|nr:type I methionyl aminopeptidase [Streptomyces calidiresistens]